MGKTLLVVLLILVTALSVDAVLLGRRTNFLNDDDIEGAWYLNSTGNETDRSGNGITLTETCSTSCDVVRDTTVPSGWSGYSRSWLEADYESLDVSDGSSGGLDISGANAEITIVAWIQMYSGIALDDYMTFVAKFDTSPAYIQYLFRLHGTGTNTFEFQFSTSSDCDTTGQHTLTSDTSNYSTGTWYFIAAVYDDVNMKIWVNDDWDGSEAESDGMCASGTTGAPFKLGCWGSSGEFVNRLNGRMTEVAVFSRALTYGELKRMYERGVDGRRGGND